MRGGYRLKRARRLVTIGGCTYEVGQMHLADVLAFLKSIQPTPRQRAIAETIVREVTTRLELLLAIGLDYLSQESPVGDPPAGNRSGFVCRRRSAQPHGDAVRAGRTEHRAAPQG